MNNILVCLLGGTIGSHIDGKSIKLGSSLNDKFWNKAGAGFQLRFIEPVTYSSENATVEDYKIGLRAVIKEVEENRPDGVLILHGTDTAAYFAQLAVRVLSFLDIPIVVTGSKLPPDDPRTDAIKNVKFALALLAAGALSEAGRKTFGIVFCESFMGESTFVPAWLATDADPNGDHKKFAVKGEETYLDRKAAMEFLSRDTSPKILTIPNVPGFPYETIDPAAYDMILIEAYHSGTQNSKTLPEYVRKAAEAKVRCYLAPAKNNKNTYESENELIKAGIIKMTDVPLEGAWAQLQLF